MKEVMLDNGVTLAYDTHGNPQHRVVFVILGITDNITDWPEGLYQPLVDAGLHVVRFELRDSGHSTKFDQFGVPDLGAAIATVGRGEVPDAGYTARDVAEDARLLMAHLKIDDACLVGYSYGAFVAQILALNAPERVSRLVCLQGTNYNPELPPRTAAVNAAMIGATVEYDDDDERIAAMMALRKATNGSIHALDDDEALDSATTSVARMYYPRGTGRIVLSRMACPPMYEDTARIKCPVLVLHADEDPIFSIEHGQDMAQRMPNAKLEVLQGAGHNHPLSLQPLIANRIAEFASEVLAIQSS
ncbi:MAG: alpha/beta hydrolase [Pseudomonadota bacterium]